MTATDNKALISRLRVLNERTSALWGDKQCNEAADALETAAAREAELQKQLDAYVASTNLRS